MNITNLFKNNRKNIEKNHRKIEFNQYVKKIPGIFLKIHRKIVQVNEKNIEYCKTKNARVQ